MTTLDDLLDVGDTRDRARDARRQAVAAVGAGLYWTGWAAFKTIRLLLLAIGAVFWTLGYTTRRIVWPALVWTAAAVRLGWEDGRKKSDAVRR